MTETEKQDRRLQSDSKVRIVSLSNFEAMLKRISGVCHRFTVEDLTEKFCYVEYSNPNEYGSENPMRAVYPVMPKWGRYLESLGWKDCERIILDMVHIQNDSHHGEGWQAFEPIKDCPELFRVNGGQWESKEEIEKRLAEKKTETERV